MTTGRIYYSPDYKSEKRKLLLSPRKSPLTADKLLKQLAGEASQRDAHNFVYRHKDLILGASDAEVEMAITKIAKALTELRVAKIDAEIAKRRAVLGVFEAKENQK